MRQIVKAIHKQSNKPAKIYVYCDDPDLAAVMVEEVGYRVESVTTEGDPPVYALLRPGVLQPIKYLEIDSGPWLFLAAIPALFGACFLIAYFAIRPDKNYILFGLLCLILAVLMSVVGTIRVCTGHLLRQLKKAEDGSTTCEK